MAFHIESEQQANASFDTRNEVVVTTVVTGTFTVDTAMTKLAGLRTTAAANHENFEVRGRKAMISLMSSVYAVWHAAQQASQAEFNKFTSNLKQKLKDLEISFKPKSSPSNLLVRYVFSSISELTDKQVHVYSRALDVATEKGIAADGFADFVNNTPGRFEGLRASAAASSSGSDKSSSALSVCVNQPTLETIDGMQWGEGEQYRVFIAVRNADDTANIKDALLPADKCKSVLLQFNAAKVALDKAKEDAGKPKTKSKAEKAVIATLEVNVTQQAAKVTQLKLELQVARKQEDAARVRDLEVAVAVAEATLAAFERSLASVK